MSTHQQNIDFTPPPLSPKSVCASASKRSSPSPFLTASRLRQPEVVRWHTVADITRGRRKHKIDVNIRFTGDTMIRVLDGNQWARGVRLPTSTISVLLFFCFLFLFFFPPLLWPNSLCLSTVESSLSCYWGVPSQQYAGICLAIWQFGDGCSWYRGAKQRKTPHNSSKLVDTALPSTLLELLRLLVSFHAKTNRCFSGL